MIIKEKDVFNFNWKPEVYEKNLYPNHAFEGLLIARKNREGKLILEDTFWSYGHDTSDDRLTIEKAFEKGWVKLLGNLNDYESCSEFEIDYYDEDDILRLHSQHGLREKYYLKKGATRSQEKIVDVLEKKIAKCERVIEYNKGYIRRHKEELEKARNGNLEEVRI